MTAPPFQLSLVFTPSQRRDAVLTAVNDQADEWDRDVVDAAIRAAAAEGQPFTANDVRPLLPRLKSNALVGGRFQALVKAGEIRRVQGQYEPSTDPATHAHPIAVWIKA